MLVIICQSRNFNWAKTSKTFRDNLLLNPNLNPNSPSIINTYLLRIALHFPPVQLPFPMYIDTNHHVFTLNTNVLADQAFKSKYC